MTNYKETVNNLFESYKKWVSENPQTVSDVETTAKWVSYFVAGRISDSSIVSELIYSLSNILVLFNDRIIEKANSLTPITEGFSYQLKLMLTTLEYCEVFIEISARKLWGRRGRWFCIAVVQIFKSIGRFILLKQCSEHIIRTPAIQALDRKKLEQEQTTNLAQQNGSVPGLNDASSFSFKLKRSGRIIRKIEGAPPIHYRNWKPLEPEVTTIKNPRALDRAETLYIAKPLVHLGAISLFGYKSWKSYTVAALMDLYSIRMYYQHQHLMTKEQRVELSRRCLNLMLYLVRSPFYETASKNRLQGLLEIFANKIPFAKTICNPLIQYIPQWQDTYFYMWST